MSRLLIAVLIAAALNPAVAARAEDKVPPAAAAAATAKFDNAAKKAKDEYDRSMLAARRQYVKDLDASMKTAMQANDLDTANAVATLKRRAEAEMKSAAPAAVPAVVDLLPLIAPKRDAIEGNWKLADHKLVTDGQSNARLMIPYEPPAEYDFAIEFRRLGAVDQVAQIFPAAGGQVVWSMGSWAKNLALVSAEGDLSATDDAAAIAGNQPHISLVQVRRDRVVVLLDNKQVANWKVVADQKPPKAWELPSPSALGVGSWYGAPTEFRRVELREIGGAGRALPRGQEK